MDNLDTTLSDARGHAKEPDALQRVLAVLGLAGLQTAYDIKRTFWIRLPLSFDGWSPNFQ